MTTIRPSASHASSPSHSLWFGVKEIDRAFGTGSGFPANSGGAGGRFGCRRGYSLEFTGYDLMIAHQVHGSRDLNRNILFAMGKNFERSETSSPCATLVTLSPSSSGGDMWL
jgi:hypothetical protein